jgi:type IV pilus assembly protein PilP
MNTRLFWSCACAILVLSACSTEEHQDLREWMKNEERGMRGSVKPLPQVKPYEPQSYDAATLIDPFSTLKAKVEGATTRGPDIQRPREPLEEFPLESLRLVGILQDKQRLIGQVLVNGRGFQVRVGNYVGQNFGRVVRIVTTKNDEKLVIKELVKDPDDQWVEKESELLLDSRGVQ